MLFDDEYPDLVDNMSDISGVDASQGMQVYKTNCATILGHIYKVGCCLVLSYRDDLPVFGILDDILIYEDKRLFVVACQTVKHFDNHIISYVLDPAGGQRIVELSQLFSRQPLSVHSYSG